MGYELGRGGGGDRTERVAGMGRGYSMEDGQGVSTGLGFCLFVKLQVNCKVSNLQDSCRNSLHLTSNGKQGTHRPFQISSLTARLLPFASIPTKLGHKKAGPTSTAKDGFGPALYYYNIESKRGQMCLKKPKLG